MVTGLFTQLRKKSFPIVTNFLPTTVELHVRREAASVMPDGITLTFFKAKLVTRNLIFPLLTGFPMLVVHICFVHQSKFSLSVTIQTPIYFSLLSKLVSGLWVAVVVPVKVVTLNTIVTFFLRPPCAVFGNATDENVLADVSTATQAKMITKLLFLP